MYNALIGNWARLVYNRGSFAAQLGTKILSYLPLPCLSRCIFPFFLLIVLECFLFSITKEFEGRSRNMKEEKELAALSRPLVDNRLPSHVRKCKKERRKRKKYGRK